MNQLFVYLRDHLLLGTDCRCQYYKVTSRDVANYRTPWLRICPHVVNFFVEEIQFAGENLNFGFTTAVHIVIEFAAQAGIKPSGPRHCDALISWICS